MQDELEDIGDDGGEIPTFDALPSASRRPDQPVAPPPAPLESRLPSADRVHRQQPVFGGGDAVSSEPAPWSGFVTEGQQRGDNDPNAEWRAVGGQHRSKAEQWADDMEAAFAPDQASALLAKARRLPSASKIVEAAPRDPPRRIVNIFDDPEPPTRYVRQYTEDGQCRLVVEGSPEDV